jgi:hypothetical protein
VLKNVTLALFDLIFRGDSSYSRMVYGVAGHKATRVALQCFNGVSLYPALREQIYVG